MDDEDLMNQIMSTFLQSTEKEIEKLQQAIGKKVSPKIKDHAHFIKGGAANAGALALQNCAKDIEQSGIAKDYNSAARLIPELIQKFEEFKNIFCPRPKNIGR
ncbi:Hpt domain-containing protein [bacterium]|nr:Hpt domain-containing protein [bacterium]